MSEIHALDCSNNTLASCAQASPPAPWSKDAQAERAPYLTALATELRALAGSDGDNAKYVTRGLGFRKRLLAFRGDALKLINDLPDKGSESCPIPEIAEAGWDVARMRMRRLLNFIRHKHEMSPPDLPDAP
jgi:hypothetical protein